MAITNRLQTLNLDASELRRAGLSKSLINEWLNIFQNLSLIANGVDSGSSQTETNTQAIASNLSTIQQQGVLISNNTSAIATNTGNISTVTDGLASHTASSSQHGVMGDNVGTEDYASSSVGGVVLLASSVSNASDSNVEVLNPALGIAPAAYDQTYTQLSATLTNEIRQDVNQLVTDVNDIVTQVNDLLSKMRTARQIDT